MIRLREYLADPEVFLAPEVTRLRAHLRVFFQVLFFATDGAGRFIADAAQLRAVLYTGALQHVSVRDVQGWLVELHTAGLIQLYTAEGLAYGKVTKKMWRQRDKLRKEIHPDEAAPPPDPDLFGGSGPELNRREFEGEVREARTGTPAPAMPAAFFKPQGSPSERPTLNSQPSTLNALSGRSQAKADQLSTRRSAPHGETESAWLERLELSWPGLDISVQLAEAWKYKRRGGGQVERGWFENSWLPNVTPAAPQAGSKFKAPEVGDGPAGWRAALETLRPGNLISPDLSRTWAELPADLRAQITNQQTAA